MSEDKKGLITRRQNKVFKETVENMKTLGVYRPEFDEIIQRYSEMRVQFNSLNKEWADGGYIVTEEYTNKSGATNRRKTALYTIIENLRAELTELENILGMTPKGLKTIKNKGLEKSKESALDKMLGGE